MIRSISFKKYKSFKAKTTIDIKPITILVGPNNSGKSSIMKLFGLIHQSYKHGKTGTLLKYDGPDVDLVNFETISHRNTRDELFIQLTLDPWEPSPDEFGEIPLKLLGYQWLDTMALSLSPNRECIQYGLSQEKRRRITFEFLRNEDQFLVLTLGDRFSDRIISNLSDEIEDIVEVFSICSGKKISRDEVAAGVRKIFAAQKTIYIGAKGISITGLGEFIWEREYVSWQKARKMLGLEEVSIEVPDHLQPLQSKATGSVTVSDLAVLLGIREHGIRLEEGEGPDKNIELGEEDRRPVPAMLIEAARNQSNQKYKDLFINWMWQYLFRKVIHDISEFCTSIIEGRVIKTRVIPTLRGNLDHITLFGPLRPWPERFYTYDQIEHLLFGNIIDGQSLDERLEKVTRAVTDGMRKLGMSCTVSFDRRKQSAGLPDFFILTVREGGSRRKYNYKDVGFGLSQIIPVLFAVNSSKTLSYVHPLIAIEQPELHLHPKAQARLAQVFVESLADHLLSGALTERKGSLQYVLETHSEHLVRGFQVLVAKGKLPRDYVAIYYVGKRKNGNSYVKKLELTDKGMFTDPWPGGFFEEDYELTKELLKYQ